MIAKVYHMFHGHFASRSPEAREARFTDGATAKFPEDYSLVADVVVEDGEIMEMLEYAFRTTNSIECAWIENANVRTALPACRSTSPGDVIEVAGDRYKVAACGWAKL